MAKECRQRRFAAHFDAAYCFCGRVTGNHDWLLRSWPWWLSMGIIVVPFTAQLRLPEYLLGFLLVGLVHRRRLIPGVTGALLLLLGGLIWGSLCGVLKLSSAPPQTLISEDCWLRGTVVDLPTTRGRALRFRMRPDEVSCPRYETSLDGDLLLNWYQPWPELKPGQRWFLKARLKPAFGSLNPGAFVYQQWLFAQGIHVSGYVRDSDRARLLETRAGVYAFQRYRGRLQTAIQSLEPRHAGLIVALSTGIRTGISDEQWKVFRRTGTAHLVAISGLHIGMMATLGYLLGLWLWRFSLLPATHYPAQSFARLVSIGAAVFYAGLAGFALPTTRALLMLVVYFLLTALRRNPGLLFTLGLVLLVVLLLDPLAPLEGGFWLSFGAVLAIALATRPVAGEPPGSEGSPGRLQRQLLLWWRVQWAVTLGLFPLTLTLFQQASLVSLPANMLAIPVIALLVVPLILLSVLCLMLSMPLVAEALLQGADMLLSGLWPSLQALSETDFAVAILPAPGVWELLLFVIGFVWLYRSHLGTWRWLGLLPMVPLLAEPGTQLEEGSYQVDLLDVGQGLAVLVRTRDHALLYDAGVSYPAGFDAGSAIVLPFMRQQGVNQLDALVASHDNIDHVGGMSAVVERFPGAARYASAAFLPGSRACESGQTWRWDGVDFRFVHPRSTSTASGNDDSCVLRIDGHFGTTLLTGDIERAAERHLLALGDGIDDIDILLVPHHGSRSSSSPPFLARTNPRLALVSAGYLNRFGHPHPDIVRRYQARGIPVFNTANSGWLNISVDQRGIVAVPYRSVYRRYWLSPWLAEQAMIVHLPPQD